jgi:hypothetical protein
MHDLSALVSDFRQLVTTHPETKKLAFAKAIGTSPSGLSAILSGVNRPTATQALLMLNVIRGGSTRIVSLQENGDFDNGGRVAREGADPDEDPASGDGDPTAISNRKAGIEGTDDPSLDNLFGEFDNLYKVIGDVLAIKKAVPNKTGNTGRNTSQTF